ncbi:MAG: transposase family protein, partial [Patescibacteria group bacterium]
MHLSYILLSKRPALFHRLTGLTIPEFERLLDQFSSQYTLLVVNPRLQAKGRIRILGGGQKGALPDIANKLLFILVYTRIYPLLIIQGMFFGMAECRACVWAGTLLPVLDEALGSAQVRPKRAKGRSLEEITDEFPELVELGVLADGVERPVQRPKKDTEKQKEQYSGKKKRHTTKRVTITHPKNQYILAASDEYGGRRHDKKIADETEMACRSPIPVGVDSGFVGYELGTAKLVLPIKKKRKKKGEPKDVLTDEQQAYNRALASARVPVEHSNAGFKRNRSAADILRNRRKGMGAQLTMVAMSLHN